MFTKIRNYRTEKGETALRFAMRLGINPDMYGRFERGSSTLPRKWWLPLAEDLGVEPNDFLDPDTGFPLWES